MSLPLPPATRQSRRARRWLAAGVTRCWLLTNPRGQRPHAHDQGDHEHRVQIEHVTHVLTGRRPGVVGRIPRCRWRSRMLPTGSVCFRESARPTSLTDLGAKQPRPGLAGTGTAAFGWARRKSGPDRSAAPELSPDNEPDQRRGPAHAENRLVSFRAGALQKRRLSAFPALAPTEAGDVVDRLRRC